MNTQATHWRKAVLPLTVSALLSAPSVAAEQDVSKKMESIVVVGQTTDTVIVPAEIEKYQANDLADIFRLVPSVSVGGSLGIAQKVYIRGLEDTLLNITVDGAQQTGTLFHHIGRVSIDPELLKEVEVQTGAGEATSGAGAIGGAIRFRTKDVADLLAADQQFGGRLKAGYFSNDGHRLSATLYGRLSDDWGLMGSFVRVDRNNMEDGDGNELYGTAADQDLLFLKTSGDIGSNQHVSLSYERREESGEFGARPNWPTLEGDTLFPMEGTRETWVFNHTLNGGDFLQLESAFYHTQSEVEQNRFDRWGLYGAEITSSGLDIRNHNRLGAHTLTYGLDYRQDEVTSTYLADDATWQYWAWDPATGSFKEEGDVIGLYLQDHWQITDALLVSAGLRYDRYSLEQVTYSNETDSNGFSPNIGLQYQLHPNWQLTVGYAEAMRGKEVGDAFTLEKRPGRVSLQPGLKAEDVNNTEVGLAYQNDNLQVTASVYRSDIDHVILDQLGNGPAPQDSVYYENVGTLETNGFELQARYYWQQLTLSASYSNNDTELNGETVEGYEHIGLANERGDTWGFNLAYQLTDSMEAGWNFTAVEDLNDIEVLQRGVEIGWIDSTRFIDKPGYQVHDVYLQWFPLAEDTLKLNLTVHNLLDEHYRDHSSVGDYNSIAGWEGVAGLYEAGRDIRLAVSYQF